MDDFDYLNLTSVEQFIFNEVVNRKERRGRIKAKYIVHHRDNSSDYKRDHDDLVKQQIKGKQLVTDKSDTGYARLYGKDGKRLAFEIPKSTATPAREKGVFNTRSSDQAMNSKARLVQIKEKSAENKIRQDEKKEGIAPHKEKIDKIANKIRDFETKGYINQYNAVMNNKIRKPIKS